MRSFTYYFAFLALLVGITLAVPAPGPCDGMEYCASDFIPHGPVEIRAPSPTTLNGRGFTNAERLARGLPLIPPTRRNPGFDRRVPVVSPTPQLTKRGIIEVSNTANGQILGYISKNSFSGAQYRYQPNEADAQILTFQADVGATSVTDVGLVSSNSDTGFPITGLVQGRDNTDSNIGPGSFHYGYIAGTNPNSGSTPATVGNSYSQATGTQRTSESFVWSINLITGATTVQWTNTDGSKPTTFIFAQGTALYFGGDPDAFHTRFPAAVINLAYTFLERP